MFGGDELAFFCYTDPELNTPAGMSRLRNLSQELGEVPGIVTSSVQDLASSLDQARLPFINIPPEKFRELTHRVLVGDDKITTAIVLRFAPLNTADVATGQKQEQVVLSPVPRPQTVRRIREIAAAHVRQTGFKTHLVGEPVQELDALHYVEEDDWRIWLYAIGVLQLLLVLCFRSLRWTLLPLVVVFVGVVWTRAILAISGVQLGMVSSMLNPVLTIIGVAQVVPIAVYYRERRRSTAARTALEATFRELAPAVTGASLAIGLGCLALLTCKIYPLDEFGWMIGVGTLLMLPAMVCILPVGILFGSKNAEVCPMPGARQLDHVLQCVWRFVATAPAVIALLTLGLVGSALAGCFRLQIETDFIKNFRPSSPIAIGLDYVERHFGGSATWEVNFPTPDEMTEEFLIKVGKLADELRQLQVSGRPALTKVICLADGEAIVPRTFFTSGLARRLWLLDKLQAEYVSTLYNADEQRMRLILRSLERQSSREKLEIIRRATEVTRQHFPEAQATGIFVVLTLLIEHLLRAQWMSLAVAAGCISMATWLAFRKASRGLICLVANICPLILVFGSMGWESLPINIATGMIASISLGVTAASSFHYLAAYQRARGRGLAVREACDETQRQAGRALVVTYLVLMAGFLALTASHFIPVIYFGIMASVTMLGGLVGNLCLLPLLLRWVEVRNSPPDLPTAV